MTPKELFMQTAGRFHLDACGVTSSHFRKELEEQLRKRDPFLLLQTRFLKDWMLTIFFQEVNLFLSSYFPINPNKKKREILLSMPGLWIITKSFINI